MRTINVVSLVAVGSISALLLCWSRHDPPKSEAPHQTSSGMSVAVIASDSTSMSHGTCCQEAANSLAEGCPANHKSDPAEVEHFAS